MEHKKTISNSSGFTLAELLIVVAIIAVLVAVSIPIFISRLEHSREVVCENNRKTLVHQIWYERMSDDGFSGNDAEQLIKDSDAYCPSLGPEVDYTLEQFDEFMVVVECKKHGKSGSGGGEEETTGKDFLENFQDFIDNFKEYSDLYPSNDNIRKEFFKKYNNKWPTLTVDGKSYSIQPYYKKPDGNISDEKIGEHIWLFARENSSSDSGWYTSLCYNPVDGKWYNSVKDNGESTGVSINNYNNINSLNDEMKNGKYENGNPKWIELKDYKESW